VTAGWTVRPPVRNQVRLNTIVPITTNTPGKPPPRVVAAQMRLSMEAGDVLLFNSAVETRADMDYATLSAGFLRYTFNGSYVNGDPLQGGLARPMGWNIWKEPHYRVDDRTAFWQVPDTGVYVVQHVIYGASSAFTGDPAEHLDIVYVDQQATVLHPEPEDARIDTLTADLLALQSRVAALEAPEEM
jgi:hypothetical protein